MGGSGSFCLVSELGWRIQLDLSKNRLAQRQCDLREGESTGGREPSVSVTMGILVNEFSSRVIRQPYFSRISNHSSSEAGCSSELLVAGSTNFCTCC